jgi:hypothetical protein
MGVGDAVDGYRHGGLDHVVEAWQPLVPRGAEVHSHGAGGNDGECPRTKPPRPACPRSNCGERAKDDGGAGVVAVGAVGGTENPTPNPSPFGYKWRGGSTAGSEILNGRKR